MKSLVQVLVDISDKLVELQIALLEALSLDGFFLEKGWPFILLFFVYGAIFPPLAMLYFIVWLTSGERYSSKKRQEKIDKFNSDVKFKEESNDV